MNEKLKKVKGAKINQKSHNTPRTSQNKGITLVALIITIILLLILAVVAIRAVSNDGIIGHAKNAQTKYQNAENDETFILDTYLSQLNAEALPVKKSSEVEIGKKFTQTTKVLDENQNTFIVPENFAIVNSNARTINSTINVTKGITITDEVDDSGNSIGNEFVWIPVGDIAKDDGTTVKIELKRRAFKDNEIIGETEDPEEKMYIYGNTYYFVEELKNTNVSDASGARDIQYFINSVKTYGGYYIGKYEAGIENYDTNRLPSDTTIANSKNWTGYVAEEGKTLQAVCKSGSRIWNFITQPKASEVAKEMYGDQGAVKSDLVNSFAYDTALIYIQEFGSSSTYAFENDGKIDAYPAEVTAGTGEDIQCGIYDLSGNLLEWTTETYSYKNPCVFRGAGKLNDFCGDRSNYGFLPNENCLQFSFRPILYF